MSRRIGETGVGLLLVASMFLLSCKKPKPEPEPEPECATHTVTLQEIAFNPDALTIRACDTVTWQHNDGRIPHTVTSGNVGDPDAGAIFDSRGGDPDARMTQGDTFSHTFDDAGTFAYHCVVHGGRGMTGSVTVNPNP